MQIWKEQIPGAMAAGRALLGPVVIVGEKCGWNGMALVWLVITAVASDLLDGVLAGRFLKTVWAALQVRGRDCKARENSQRASLPRRLTVAAAGLLVLALAAPAFAADPQHGQAAYAGGTSGIALETPGTLDTTPAKDLIFRYQQRDGKNGEVAIAYAKIRSVETRNDVVRHLGFLPAVAAGLVAARQRRYTLAISYGDSDDVMQVAIFQMTERDQMTMKGILHARAPEICMATQYTSCAARPSMQKTVPPAATAK